MNTCKVCGKPCKRQWCSQACNAKSRKSGETRVCQNCGEIFYLRPSYQKKGGGKYCSDYCRRIYQTAHTKGYLKIGTTPIHRIVAAEKLGRPLVKGEVVHHVDGDPHNNAPENLLVFPSQAEHMRVDPNASFARLTPDQRIAAGKKSGEARKKKANHLQSQISEI